MAARLGAETAYDVDYAGTASLCNEVGSEPCWREA